MSTVIEGKPEAIELATAALLAEAHLLIEDVPGVGKTMLCQVAGQDDRRHRPADPVHSDLLPSDITGVSVYNQSSGNFEFKPGSVSPTW